MTDQPILAAAGATALALQSPTYSQMLAGGPARQVYKLSKEPLKNAGVDFIKNMAGTEAKTTSIQGLSEFLKTPLGLNNKSR